MCSLLRVLNRVFQTADTQGTAPWDIQYLRQCVPGVPYSVCIFLFSAGYTLDILKCRVFSAVAQGVVQSHNVTRRDYETDTSRVCGEVHDVCACPAFITLTLGNGRSANPAGGRGQDRLHSGHSPHSSARGAPTNNASVEPGREVLKRTRSGQSISDGQPATTDTVVWPAAGSQSPRGSVPAQPLSQSSRGGVDYPELDLLMAAMSPKKGDGETDEQEEMLEKLFEDTSCVNGDDHIDRVGSSASLVSAPSSVTRCNAFLLRSLYIGICLTDVASECL